MKGVGRLIERVDPRMRRVLAEESVRGALYKEKPPKPLKTFEIIPKNGLKIGTEVVKAPSLFIPVFTEQVIQPKISSGISLPYATAVTAGIIGIASTLSSGSPLFLLPVLASMLLPFGASFFTSDEDPTGEYPSLTGEDRGLPGFYQPMLQKDLAILRGILDYVAVKHGYGALQEITQDLDRDEPPINFYEIYNGARSMVFEKEDDDRFDRYRMRWAYYNMMDEGYKIDGRFYLVVKPELYTKYIERISSAFRTTGVPFKTSKEVQKNGSATRRDHFVIYFPVERGPDVLAALSNIMDLFESENPGLFSEKGPYLTLKLRNGLFFGEESPYEWESFGGYRSGVIKKAIEEMDRLVAGGATVTPEARALIVAHFFEAAGIDPENPAFNKGGREKFPFLFKPIEKLKEHLVRTTLSFSDRRYVFKKVNIDLAEVWPEGSDSMTIGSDLLSDLRILDKNISRGHFLLKKNGDGTYTLTDKDRSKLISVGVVGKSSGREVMGDQRSFKTVLEPGRTYRVWFVWYGMMIYIKIP